MIFETALYNYLSTHAGITALASTRIYPAPLPQGATLPAITYMQVSGVPIRTMGGRQGRSRRIQIDCWATTSAGRRAMAEAVISALDHYSGTMGGSGGVTVRGAFLQNDLDDYDPETKRYRAILDFIIHHEEIT